jgi:hypothetical protein
VDDKSDKLLGHSAGRLLYPGHSPSLEVLPMSADYLLPMWVDRTLFGGKRGA